MAVPIKRGIDFGRTLSIVRFFSEKMFALLPMLKEGSNIRRQVFRQNQMRWASKEQQQSRGTPSSQQVARQL
jgi:hypothetical protein